MYDQAVIFVFLSSSVSVSIIWAQTANITEGENSRILYAQNVATIYGVKPAVDQAVIDLYSESGLNKEQRKKKLKNQKIFNPSRYQ